MTPEGRVKAAVKRALETRHIVRAGSAREMQQDDADATGWYYMPIKGAAFGINGIPDFIGCHRGRFFAIETKAGKGILTAHQVARSLGILRGGGEFFVVSDNSAGLKQLNQWIEHADLSTQKSAGAAAA